VRPQRIRPFCFHDSQPPADRTFVNSEGGRDFDFQPPHAIQFNGSESPPFSNLSPNLLLVAHPLILKVALFMQLSVDFNRMKPSNSWNDLKRLMPFRRQPHNSNHPFLG
jgi:hypothetical protein